MEHMRIKIVSEGDFDEIIKSAGGRRILEEDSADYRLNEAVIELKLISEEGFEKTERQRKIAHLFRQAQPRSSVVVINPTELNNFDSQSYYRIVETPIKNACKKASKQLQITAARFTPNPVRVMVILNIGYTQLSSNEFQKVCSKCVHNDTSGIDWMVCGGIYYYGDTIDHYVISNFEEIPINLNCSFPSSTLLLEAWGQFLNKIMLEALRNPNPNGRTPVVDLAFELEGIRYIKPAPKIKSDFWPGGMQPRKNSSGIDHCPPVALTFPSFTENEWSLFKEAMSNSNRLGSTYKNWMDSCPSEQKESRDPLKPFVFITTKFAEFAKWINKPEGQWQFSDIGEFSCELLHQNALSLFEQVKDKKTTSIVPLEYIHLVIKEVGNDEANDFASLYYISEIPGFECEETLFENARLFFQYGMAVAASYAIKRKVDAIMFTKLGVS